MNTAVHVFLKKMAVFDWQLGQLVRISVENIVYKSTKIRTNLNQLPIENSLYNVFKTWDYFLLRMKDVSINVFLDYFKKKVILANVAHIY